MIPLIGSFVLFHQTLRSGKRAQLLSQKSTSSIPDNDVLDYHVKTFEAIAPDETTLVGFALISLLSVFAYFVWANEVVPISRTKLALSKRDGEVRTYLDNLAAGVIIEDLEADESNQTLLKSKNDGRNFERWLFSDWLNNNKSSKGGRKKPSALPILKNAKWNSGDNPVLVTSALLMLGVLFAAITERIAS